ncbi:hypothetical protein OQI_33845 [Streptomyces pharetrae CZA14]|uniref:Uncharacterized protein n=1 Tax=Streptomyces pharetrae CZA14 TaxID=1144883 RepID=A0ABX3Y9Q3_9ACTN|nr:hypothetical protein OQI_33845 [Streptomyces pharetrae CZA14]
MASCTRPSWSVDVRTDPGEFRERHGGDAHACPNDTCDHGDRYERTTVRIVCRSCQAALVIRGEDASTSKGMTANTTYGYGHPPRTVAGLLLWPGEPWLNCGRLGSDEPYDYVVTRKGVTRPTEADIVGVITQGRSKRRAVIWQAGALPAPATYGRFNWGATNEDKPARTVAAAAKWMAARLAEQQAGGDQ